MESKGYAIYDLTTGQQVAQLGPDGLVQEDGNPQAVAKLKTLLQHEIVIREGQLDPSSEEEFDPFPEENMCYFGVITIRPGDPAYLKAFVRRLPYISYYEARPL